MTRDAPSPLASAFLPTRVVSANVMRGIIAVQVAAFFLLWLTSPFAVLPTPPEVLGALRVLWFERGLGPELVASFRLNIVALALSAAISLGLSYLTVLGFVRPLV